MLICRKKNRIKNFQTQSTTSFVISTQSQFNSFKNLKKEENEIQLKTQANLKSIYQR